MTPMHRIWWYVTVLSCELVVLCVAKQPNIVLMVADDYGWNDIGYHGSDIRTPNLDRLAAEGVKLENYYVQPTCSPTRGQLLSGRYQIHTGTQNCKMAAGNPSCFPLDTPTLAGELRKLGYSTHMVGKWHLGFYRRECTPLYRGFDSFLGFLTGQGDYYTHNHCWAHSKSNSVLKLRNKKNKAMSDALDEEQHKQACGLDMYHDLEPVDRFRGQYSTHVFANHASKVVEDHAKDHPSGDKPLFMYLAFQAVHGPLQVPRTYSDKYAHIRDKHRRIFAGMTSCMDEAVANVTQSLKKNHMWDNTILVFTTGEGMNFEFVLVPSGKIRTRSKVEVTNQKDNGAQVYRGGSNWPLRGWKATLWEGGMRGVGFVHSPLLEQTAVESHELMHVSDWFPTLVGLAGGSTAGLALDGHDVWRAISHGEASPRTEILHNIDPLIGRRGNSRPGSPFDVRVRGALRVGGWKLLTGNPGDSGWKPLADSSEVLGSGTKSGVPMFLSDDPGRKNVWLFDIENDPNEKVDVSELHPAVVSNMLQVLARYNATSVAPIYEGYDPQSLPAYNKGVWGPWRGLRDKDRLDNIELEKMAFSNVHTVDSSPFYPPSSISSSDAAVVWSSSLAYPAADGDGIREQAAEVLFSANIDRQQLLGSAESADNNSEHRVVLRGRNPNTAAAKGTGWNELLLYTFAFVGFYICGCYFKRICSFFTQK